MITITHLRKTFGAHLAVADVSFVAQSGLVTGVLGPNGAGKTTILRLLTGLLRPDAGGVTIDAVDVQQAPLAARARLGVLPEQTGLYDRLTVREHIAYAVALRGVRGAEASALVDAALTRAGLTPLHHRLAATLSFGERRRTALACALAHAPANVVLDEPTNGLDVPGVREMRTEIRRLAASGCAVVVSTHVMQEVRAICDRVVVMARGVVVAEGTPDELIARSGRSTLEDAFVHAIGSAEGLQQ